ncbi:two-component sensor histidine kinase [Citrobacter sp. NCU1]|uniref:ATP-binding protein n=2 Tax=Citrobacter sp. NCU1 TaxID=2026683 RepID=UPI00139208DC|nr:ATP-binding protein [Citrobacter sp. NCU1]NDO81746.1 two-component sensor histidine kinase [Citrobacter sp. NCU1]
MRTPCSFIIKNRWRFHITSIFLLLLMLTVSVLFLHMRFMTLVGTDKMRLEMYKSTLYSTIDQYYILPYMLSMDNIIKQSMDPSNDNVSERLNKHVEYFNTQLKTAAIFILNAQGKTIASSNWKEPGSYVGQDYSYRPYYKQAMMGLNGRFYGIGSTTNTPGFFLSTGIRHEGKIVGVVVVKISLNDIENVWAEGPENIIVSDEHSIIFLSSKSQWRMRTLEPLPSQIKEKLQLTRQYSLNNLLPADYYPCFKFNDFIFLKEKSNQFCLLPRFYTQQIPIPEFNWKMTIIVPLDNLYWTLAISLVITLILYLLVLVIIKYWRMRSHAQQLLTQANETLEMQVKERTYALESMNQKLLQEMKERSQAEHIIQLTRSELAESNKLAALGQMATEIAHEQNQPLAAIHALTDNARTMLAKKMYSQTDQNLKYIISVVERMTQLMSELKTFASRHRVPKGSADVIKVMYSAVALLNHSMEKNNLERRIKTPSSPLFVGCDELGLEQIFSNLITNALDAMEDQQSKRLDISIYKTDHNVIITLKDNGCGFSPQIIERIFEAFFTTKRRGIGLGLAIVSEIVRNSNGTIHASNHPEGGAMITLSWPEWREDNGK